MSSGSPTKPESYSRQVVNALRDRYPKFTKVQLSLARNPAYGLQLSPEAVSILESKGIAPPGKAKRKAFKQAPKRSKQNRITIRLNDEQKVRFLQAKEKSGCKTVQEYLESLIERDLKGV